jgi:hypothetical protein
MTFLLGFLCIIAVGLMVFLILLMQASLKIAKIEGLRGNSAERGASLILRNLTENANRSGPTFDGHKDEARPIAANIARFLRSLSWIYLGLLEPWKSFD